MALYESSTHCKEWVLTAEQILALREKKNETLGISEEEEEQQHHGGERLSIEEEIELLRLYTLKLVEICEKQEYSSRVKWTAAILFRRYYIFSSFTELSHNAYYHPAVVMLTAIFVAGKSEEEPLSLQERGIRLERLCSAVNVDTDLVADAEMEVLRVLKFQLVVFHPVDALNDLLFELENQFKSKSEVTDLSNDVWKDFCAVADESLLQSLFSDCCITFSPTLIAIGALVSASRSIQKDVHDFPVTCDFIFSMNFSKFNSLHSYNKEYLKLKTDHVVKMLESGRKFNTSCLHSAWTKLIEKRDDYKKRRKE